MSFSCIEKVFGMISQETEEEGGVIIVNEKFGVLQPIKLKNTSKTPTNNFEYDPIELAKAIVDKEVAFFWHTHPREEEAYRFQENDLKFSLAWAKPIAVFNKNLRQTIYHFPPNRRVRDIYTRPFIQGYWDCFTIVKDYHKIMFNRELDYVSSHEMRRNQDAIEYIVEKYDGKIISFEEREHGDILFFLLKPGYLHCAVVLDRDRILHQTEGDGASIENINECNLFKNKFLIARSNKK